MCPSEVSDIEHTLWRTYGPLGVQVWGIASNEPDDTVRAFAEDMGVTFPILLDRDGSVYQEYYQLAPFPSAAYPRDWMVDPAGRIGYVNNGFEPDEMTRLLDEWLGL